MKDKVILVIEDDPDILELVQYNLDKQGFRVRTAENGETGLRDAQRDTPDLIVLDLMLPGMDGMQVCRKLREHPDTKGIPILMLTAKSEESDIVAGLEVGADDYLTKPFSNSELVARIRALLRRGHWSEDSEAREQIKVGSLTIDSGRHEVYMNGEPLSLTLAEFRLLRMLASRPGRVFTRDQLLESISGGDTYLIDRNVDVHIRAIRKKLADDAGLISTVRGVGYKCLDAIP